MVVGTPEKVTEHPTSHTGRYLKQVLEQHPPEVLWQVEWRFEGGLGGVGEGRGRTGSGLGGCLIGSGFLCGIGRDQNEIDEPKAHKTMRGFAAECSRIAEGLRDLGRCCLLLPQKTETLKAQIDNVNFNAKSA